MSRPHESSGCGCGTLIIIGLLLMILSNTCKSQQPAPLPAPPQISHMHLSVEATHVLDSLANKSRQDRVETAACLTSYAVRDSLLEVEVITPAVLDTTDHADSVHVKFLCPVGTPDLHTHVIQGGDHPPSNGDFEDSKERGVWCLLLQVHENGYGLYLY